MNGSCIPIDTQGPLVEADCLHCLVALPIAIDRMRGADNDFDLPKSMVKRALEAFNKVDLRPRGVLIDQRGTSTSGTART